VLVGEGDSAIGAPVDLAALRRAARLP
jgi:hypothetical protein